jgi:putative GTP pyrophosphokinase
MEFRPSTEDDVDSWKEVQLLYSSALKEMETKLEILNEEFQHVHKYNPIEHIKSRIKTSESIVKKLKKYGYESTIENMVEYINDMAGVRIICSFTSDIYCIAEILRNQPDLQVISVKDYIQNPKESGYMSYHMLLSVPVSLSDKIVDVKVEVQIRTVAMDFWASLEHKIRYKFEGNAPSHISEQLEFCSRIVADLDTKMMNLNEEIQRQVVKNSIENKKEKKICEKIQPRVI